jgi:folate-binding protein YgfZ
MTERDREFWEGEAPAEPIARDEAQQELRPPTEQYDALRSGGGYFELANWSSVTFTGGDRVKFLNSFSTNDVTKLSPGLNCEAFITNVKGKTIGYGLIDCREEELVFITVPNQGRALLEHFDRYIIREDVQLRDTSGERWYLHVLMLPPLQSARWIGWRLLGRESGAVFEVAAADGPQLRQVLSDRKCARCDLAAFESLRIEAGTPLFGVDFDESNLPQEVGRDGAAISFTKGCYLGQETVARIDALGHVNQRLVGVRFSGAEVPATGTELLRDGAKVGRVTSAAFSPRLGAPLSIAMVRREANAAGTRLDSAVGECEVVALPLGDGEKLKR